MVKFTHENGSHTVAFVDEAEGGRLRLTILRDAWVFFGEIRDGRQIWVAAGANCR